MRYITTIERKTFHRPGGTGKTIKKEMKIKVKVLRPSGIEEIVEMPFEHSILRKDYDRACALTRKAGRGEILGIVEGKIIEPLSKGEVAELKNSAMSGSAFYGIGSGLAEIRERNAARENECRED